MGVPGKQVFEFFHFAAPICLTGKVFDFAFRAR